jgi:hypothetical protein
MKKINEFIAAPIPLVSRVVAELHGENLYSSPFLKRQYLTALSETPKTRPIISEISHLVDRKLIIPCLVSKSILSYIIHKTINPNHDLIALHGILGFYTRDSKKIYIVTNNNNNFFESNSKLALAKYTIHELMHMIADRNSDFINIFKSELEQFYYNYYKDILKLKNKVDVFPVVQFIYSLESSARYTMKDVNNYYRVLYETFKDHTEMKKEEFEKILIEYCSLVKIYLSSMSAFKNNFRKYIHILGPIYKAYKTTYGINVRDNLCIQELLTISETICIYSEVKTNTKVYSAIKALVKGI